MKKTVKSAFIMLLGIALSASCTKTVQGEKGEKGDTGATGNANVTSVTFTANSNSWQWSSNYNEYDCTFTNVSILTSQVVSGGAVMLYEADGSNWIALPYTVSAQNGNDETYSSNFEYGVNTITISQAFSDGIQYSITSSTQYKLVCIPQHLVKKNPNVDMANYEQVKYTFGIND